METGISGLLSPAEQASVSRVLDTLTEEREHLAAVDELDLDAVGFLPAAWEDTAAAIRKWFIEGGRR